MRHMLNLIGVSLILLLSVSPAKARKSKLPEWAQNVLEEVAQDSVAASGNHDAVYLLNEKIVQFDGKTGSEEITTRGIIRILNADGVQYGQNFSFYFDNHSSIREIRAWTLKSDGKIISLDDKNIVVRSSYGYIDYSDLKYTTFNLPDIGQGDVIVYEVIKDQMHPIWSFGFSGYWHIQDEIPVRQARFTIKLPPMWSYRYKIYFMDDRQPVEKKEGEFTWQWDDVAALSSDTMPFGVSYGQLKYSCSTEDPRLADRNRESWDEIAANYERLSSSRLALNDEMKQVVADLTRNATTDLEKTRLIANYVRQNLTYVAVEIGIGGFQPRHVQRIFQNKYGDCKDMSALLISMLGEAGITAYPALIYTVNRGFSVDPDFPMNTFNHCIAFVPEVIGTDPWIEAWPTEELFGRGLWVDPTWDTSSIQDLPWTVQGTHALVVTPEKGHLIKTPVLGPLQNIEVRTGRAKLTLRGDLEFEAVESRKGNPDMWYKNILKSGTKKERLEWAQRYIGDNVPRSNLVQFNHSALEDLDTPFQFDYQFTAKRYANIAGKLTFFRPNVMNAIKSNPYNQKEQKYPVIYKYPYTDIDSLTFEIPETYMVDDLPESVDIETEFGIYQISYTMQEELLTYQRRLSITQRVIPAESYEALKTFYQTVVRSDKAQVVLRRKPLTMP